jgi:predicted RNA-binding Zn-ribbon protein involved in translation (DUF1610 family)
MRLIDADAAIDAFKELTANGTNKGMVFGEDAVHRIEILPSVQPEHKTGRWIPDNTDYYRTKFICSACGESEEVPTMGFGYAPMWGYCPNCGADMRGEQE